VRPKSLGLTQGALPADQAILDAASPGKRSLAARIDDEG